jgi:glycosyltransferase involved in cell wall biosynthesis
VTTAPTFSFVVPTHREDRPLKRCLDSIAWQLGKEDEVIVVGDTCDGPLPMVEHLVSTYDVRFQYLPHDAGGYHDFGHSQLNYGIARARGEWIHCNDDDDVWLPGALDVMRAGALTAGGAPLLFRFVSYVGGMIIWAQRGRLERNWIGGHCLVAPNDQDKLGKWAPDYTGDFDYIEQTVQKHSGQAIWREEIICKARPA